MGAGDLSANMMRHPKQICAKTRQIAHLHTKKLIIDKIVLN